MISITQRLVNRGRAAVQSSPLWTRNFSASSSVNQGTFDFDEETESAEEQQPPTRDLRREKFVNKISLYGTVGKKPEEFGTEGREVTIFPLLTKTYYGPHNQKTEEKSWHKVMLTNSNRGTRQWALDRLNPGDKVMVTGSILYKNVDPENVNAGKMTTIVADTTILAEQNQKAHGDRD